MEISQKDLLIKWKDILAQYLNPISIVDELHEFFPLHSRQRNQVLAKEEQPHVAVDIMIKFLMESEIAGAYPRLLEVVKTQHPWLIPFITGEIDEECLPGGTSKIQYQDYVYKLLTIFAPSLAENIQATEVSADMKAKEFLNQEEEERVNAKAINSGNTAAVRTLLSILVRKPIEWLQAFKSTIRDQNYNNMDMVDDIPDSIEEFSELTISIDANKKDYIPLTGLHSDNSKSSTHAFIESSNNLVNGVKVFVHPTSEYHHQSESDRPYSQEHPDSTILGAAANPPQQHSELQYDVDKLYGDLHGTAQQESAIFPPANNIIPKEAGYVPRKQKSVSSVNKKECANAIKRQPSLSAAVGNNAIILTDERLEVAWNIIKSRFPHILDSTNRRIGFLVPKITKSYDSLRRIFDSPQWSVAFYGPEPCKELRALMHESQVIVMSAESFHAWLMEDSDVGKIGEFDVLIFDQCFQSHDKGPYKEVLLKYLSTRKNEPGRIQTQVIGLANSISSVRLSTLNQADNVILDLVSLFDARAGIDGDLEGANKKKNPSTSSKRSGSKKNEISDPFVHYLCINMDNIVDLIYKLPIRQLQDVKHPRKIGKGTLEYGNWCEDVSKKIADLADSSDNPKYLMTCCVKFLRTFNDGFIIKTNCRAVDAVHFLGRQLEVIKPTSSAQESHTVEKRLSKIVSEAEEKLPLFHSMDGVEDSSSLDKIEHCLFAQCKQKQLSHILIVVGAQVTIEYLQTWMDDKVLPKLSMTQRKAKRQTGNSRPTVKICYCDELPRNMQQFDLTLCYDCQIGANKSKQLVHVESDHILANEKVKFSKILLIKKAIESMQKLCKNEPTAYLNLLLNHQEKLLDRQPM